MCHGDLNCLWFFEARPVFNAVISYLSSAEWHVFFIHPPPPPLTQLAGTLHFEFSFLDYKGARNLSQSILKQAVTPQIDKEFLRLPLHSREGGTHRGNLSWEVSGGRAGDTIFGKEELWGLSWWRLWEQRENTLMQRGGSVHCEQNPGDVGVVLGAVLGEQAKSEHCPQVSLDSITGDLTLTVCWPFYLKSNVIWCLLHFKQGNKSVSQKTPLL